MPVDFWLCLFPDSPSKRCWLCQRTWPLSIQRESLGGYEHSSTSRTSNSSLHTLFKVFTRNYREWCVSPSHVPLSKRDLLCATRHPGQAILAPDSSSCSCRCHTSILYVLPESGSTSPHLYHSETQVIPFRPASRYRLFLLSSQISQPRLIDFVLLTTSLWCIFSFHEWSRSEQLLVGKEVRDCRPVVCAELAGRMNEEKLVTTRW